ncbi:ROK family protein [Paenibacillus nasutitermitis]|uniref:Glucokinase n=1 Tax=Paenibacillus nasutitermitis TaxID=1652958 RepID=A0A917DUR3_9BACL|nr:ROK family protein [Paenibacillus nasutitermitis]GGD72317.1 glucokinase [Paenibacillus nasutitermitis]
MIIAIDFGGTNIKIGLVDEGKMLAQTHLPSYSERGLRARLVVVEQEIYTLLQRQNAALPGCSGIGIATPGIVDTTRRTILSINNKYADAVGFDFEKWAQETFALPLLIENDARAALLGEVHYGIARGAKDAVLLTFGTGIGTSAMMNGQVIRGKHFQAGILGGHFSTDINGNVCNCGNKGCLEAQAGHWALSYAVKRHPDYLHSELSKLGILGYGDIIHAAHNKDVAGIDVLDELVAHWSAGIVNMIHAYDPEIVILSGGLMKSQQFLLAALYDNVNRMSWTPWGEVEIAVASDPDASVLLGLSSLFDSTDNGSVH